MDNEMHAFTAAASRIMAEHDMDPEHVSRMADEALRTPPDAYFSDSELYSTHTLMFHTPDWSITTDYAIDQANYRAALSELTSRFPRDVEDASVGHWTYSRFVCIKVRVLTPTGKVTAAFAYAMSLVLAIQDYPLLDEDIHSELELEVWDATLDDALAYAARDDETLTPERQQIVREYLSERYGPGYFESGYLPDDQFQAALEYSLNPQPHQTVSLF